jgi:hypothetical protein
VIYSYNKSQQDALFLKFILVKNYMFWTDLLSSIRSFNTVYTGKDICHASYVDCLHDKYLVLHIVLKLLMMDSRFV